MKIKGLIVIISVLLGAFCAFTSCAKINSVEKNTENISTTNTKSFHSDSSETNIKITDNSSKESEDIGGGIITVQKYRHKFYSVPGPFVDYVDRDEYYEWLYTIDHTSTAEIMVIKQFVQHFNISREQFDKANLECAKRIRDKLNGVPCINPKDYANQEDDEIYNTDIIFTFNDELIREYYLSPDYPYIYDFEFEESVANGEYTSQTEEWVDVEQMEAEIIAKYGEAEIVTEITSAEESLTSTDDAVVPEETTVIE